MGGHFGEWGGGQEKASKAAKDALHEKNRSVNLSLCKKVFQVLTQFGFNQNIKI